MHTFSITAMETGYSLTILVWIDLKGGICVPNMVYLGYFGFKEHDFSIPEFLCAV